MAGTGFRAVMASAGCRENGASPVLRVRGVNAANRGRRESGVNAANVASKDCGASVARKACRALPASAANPECRGLQDSRAFRESVARKGRRGCAESAVILAAMGKTVVTAATLWLRRLRMGGLYSPTATGRSLIQGRSSVPKDRKAFRANVASLDCGASGASKGRRALPASPVSVVRKVHKD